jgi:parallel beta-helix repeat protein
VKTTVTRIILTLLLIGILAFTFQIQPVKASGTVYIRADGSIDPPTAPIITSDNVTYTLIGNVTSDADGIVVERDNIIIDGAGYTVQGTPGNIGIDLSGRTNVTVRNTQIIDFYNGVWLVNSSNNSISKNNISTSYYYGIWLNSSFNNNISGNTIENVEYYGIRLYYSFNNSLCGNTILDTMYGTSLSYSSNNSVIGNTFISDGLTVRSSYQNSVENNTVNGKPLVYLEGVVNCSVADAGQVILVNCDNVRVENVNLSRTDIGVELWRTNNSIISSNIITYDECGVYLYYSSNNTIYANNIAENSCGIDFYSSLNCSISGNNITANGSYGIYLGSSSNNSISGNNMANNLLHNFFLYSSSNNSICGNAITHNVGSIELLYSSSNSICGNNIADDQAHGILLYSSSSNRISRNNIVNDQYGIKLSSSNNNSICENNIVNDKDGIELYSSSNNSIYENNITRNSRYGIFFSSSSGNIIYHNSFNNNTQQIDDYVSTSRNVWDDEHSTGNYWSDYSGVDSNNDGIGDSYYIIDYSDYNRDYYPLMRPWVTPNIAIENLTASRNVTVQGCSLELDVTVKNFGSIRAVFNLIVYANSTIIKSEYDLLASNQTSLITVIWNTAGFAKGNYTIKAIAEPVAGETNTEDNSLTNGWVLVTKLGDLGGGMPIVPLQCDGVVNGKDLSLFLLCFKGLIYPPTCTYIADLGSGSPPQFFLFDGKVDGADLALFLICFKGQGPDP